MISKRLAGSLFVQILMIVLVAQLAAGLASAQLVTEDLSGGLTPDDLAAALVGEGLTVSNVTYVGAPNAAGSFSGGDGIVGIEGGVILSSGDVANVVGPNVTDSITTQNGTPGDADLDALLTNNKITLDAAVLEFDFVPDGDTLFIQYVFASDEYNEFVNSQFNDIFAFFAEGVNCATVDGEPVTINSINNGNPFDTDPRSNPDLYINNDLEDGGGSINTEMDGLTVVLTCEAAVTSGATNHLKLAIADVSDQALDTVIFLAAGGITTEPPGPGGGPSVPEIPTLDELGLIVLALCLAIAGLALKRRRTTHISNS